LKGCGIGVRFRNKNRYIRVCRYINRMGCFMSHSRHYPVSSSHGVLRKRKKRLEGHYNDIVSFRRHCELTQSFGSEIDPF